MVIIYGVDVLVTDDDHFFILEFNGNTLGHGRPNELKGTEAYELYGIKYANDYFFLY